MVVTKRQIKLLNSEEKLKKTDYLLIHMQNSFTQIFS